MLKLNIEKHCRLRGIINPVQYLQKAGISYFMAYKLVNGHSDRISIKKLEWLCNVFKCTPNDLFDWTPNDNDEATDKHHLAELRAEKNAPLAVTFSKLSYKELKQFSKEVIEKK